jgi:hypothetical protein
MECMSEQERFENGALPRELPLAIGNVVLNAYAEQLSLFPVTDL